MSSEFFDVGPHEPDYSANQEAMLGAAELIIDKCLRRQDLTDRVLNFISKYGNAIGTTSFGLIGLMGVGYTDPGNMGQTEPNIQG